MSLTRASDAVNCQFTVCGRALRLRSHAATSCCNVSMSSMRRDRHCRDKTDSSHSAMLSHLPCSGVKCHSKRSVRRRASSGAKRSYRKCALWVLRLSHTSTIFSACGYTTSARYARRSAMSTPQCWSRTLTPRVPTSGSYQSSRLALPFLAYS